jgi:DNA-binding IclR family transcriptional regulator
MKQSEVIDSKYIIPNLQNALELMDLVSNYPNGIGLPEMAQITDVPKSTLFRICSTLLANGYFIKDEENGRFLLSRKTLRIGLTALGEESLIEKAVVPMRLLRDEVSETVLLGVLMEEDVALLEQVIGNHPFTFFIKPGKHFVIHASAPGKALIAFLNESEREAILDRIDMVRYNARTITTKEAMRKEIDWIQAHGYAVDRAEEMDGVHCVAAPVFNQHREPIAAIWTTGPSSRLKENDFESVAAKVVHCARQISHTLGYKI